MQKAKEEFEKKGKYKNMRMDGMEKRYQELPMILSVSEDVNAAAGNPERQMNKNSLLIFLIFYI